PNHALPCPEPDCCRTRSGREVPAPFLRFFLHRYPLGILSTPTITAIIFLLRAFPFASPLFRSVGGRKVTHLMACRSAGGIHEKEDKRQKIKAAENQVRTSRFGASQGRCDRQPAISRIAAELHTFHR